MKSEIENVDSVYVPIHININGLEQEELDKSDYVALADIVWKYMCDDVYTIDINEVVHYMGEQYMVMELQTEEWEMTYTVDVEMRKLKQEEHKHEPLRNQIKLDFGEKSHE